MPSLLSTNKENLIVFLKHLHHFIFLYILVLLPLRGHLIKLERYIWVLSFWYRAVFWKTVGKMERRIALLEEKMVEIVEKQSKCGYMMNSHIAKLARRQLALLREEVETFSMVVGSLGGEGVATDRPYP